MKGLTGGCAIAAVLKATRPRRAGPPVARCWSRTRMRITTPHPAGFKSREEHAIPLVPAAAGKQGKKGRGGGRGGGEGRLGRRGERPGARGGGSPRGKRGEPVEIFLARVCVMWLAAAASALAVGALFGRVWLSRVVWNVWVHDCSPIYSSSTARSPQWRLPPDGDGGRGSTHAQTYQVEGIYISSEGGGRERGGGRSGVAPKAAHDRTRPCLCP